MRHRFSAILLLAYKPMVKFGENNRRVYKRRGTVSWEIMSQKVAKEEIKNILGINDVSGGSADMHKLVEELLSDANIEGKTDLNANQIVAIARASWFADRYDSDAMRVIVRYVTKYLQSKDRKGRTELVSAITGVFRYELEKQKIEKVEI